MTFPTVGEIHDTIHPEGWRWANLTSWEQAQSGGLIEDVLDALKALGYDPEPPVPLPKSIPHVGRFTEWLMGRVGEGVWEVRLEFRPESEDWLVWSVKDPETSFVAHGRHDEISKQAKTLSGTLLKADRARREVNAAMRQAATIAASSTTQRRSSDA